MPYVPYTLIVLSVLSVLMTMTTMTTMMTMTAMMIVTMTTTMIITMTTTTSVDVWQGWFATCRRGQCKEQWLVRGAQGRAMGERAASRVLYIISGLQVFITWMQWARAHFILPMAHLWCPAWGWGRRRRAGSRFEEQADDGGGERGPGQAQELDCIEY